MRTFAESDIADADVITLFLCGDVMTGRGIDQVLPYPGNPRLYEPYVTNAQQYVTLMEKVNGPIQKPVNFSYVWGEALDELNRVDPNVRIINFESSITTSDNFWPAKDIHYRMNPKNIPCLEAAQIDCCTLANNHILDWGYAGLRETLFSLKQAKLACAGAGERISEAEKPAILNLQGRGRVLIFSLGMLTSGIPQSWAAGSDQPGVNLLADFSDDTILHLTDEIQKVRLDGDIVVASIHWGGNWGYEIPDSHKTFAHHLITDAQVDIVHGHSSHHVKGIEIYEGKPILYGCGDFLNDYEGIGGYEEFRSYLTVMYFISMNPVTGRLVQFTMTPMRMRRFALHRASSKEATWLKNLLNREGRALGTQVVLNADNTFSLQPVGTESENGPENG